MKTGLQTKIHLVQVYLDFTVSLLVLIEFYQILVLVLGGLCVIMFIVFMAKMFTAIRSSVIFLLIHSVHKLLVQLG